MARERFDRAFRPTTPRDTSDPPRFAQPVETTLDVFAEELRQYLINDVQTAERKIEIPTIHKFSDFTSDNDPLPAKAKVIQKMSELKEALPHIAIMSAQGQERRLNIGPPFIGTVQDPCRVQATLPEPYALVDGDKLFVRVVRKAEVFIEEITFTTNRFPSSDPISAALAADVADEINAQASHFKATTVDDAGDTYLLLIAGGSEDKSFTPQDIEIHPDTDDNVLDVTGFGRRGDVIDIGGTTPDMTITATAASFTVDDVGRNVWITDATKSYFNDGRFEITDRATAGVDTLTYTNKYGRSETDSPATWFIGLRDDATNTARPPKHRFVMAWDLTVNVDIITPGENERRELSDLVASFFSFYLEDKYFTFMGRTGFTGQTVTGETYQIILQNAVRHSGENELPRPSGDGRDKIYVASLAVPVTTLLYVDREVYVPGTTTPFIVDEVVELVEDSTMPLPGDDGSEDTGP